MPAITKDQAVARLAQAVEDLHAGEPLSTPAVRRKRFLTPCPRIPLAVYASPRGLPRHGARLASGCWPGSAGRDWLPAGFRRKVSVTSAHRFPLPQAFLAQ